MNGKRYTEREINFLKENFRKYTNPELAKKLGRTLSSIQSMNSHLGLVRDRKWTEEKKSELARLYKSGMTLREISAHMNVPLNAVKAATNNFKILSGRTGCFPKGHRPWNFRTKGLVKATQGMKRTQFKKGNLPANTLHDLAITVRLDHPKTRKGRPYKWIRIAKGKWVHYHRWLWEQAHGPVPAKHMVIFKDGNTMNCVLSNLELITMAENAMRNYNKEKAATAARDLTDNYIAGRLAKGDKQLRKAIIHGAPDLIKAKREQLKLKRLINERENETREAGR